MTALAMGEHGRLMIPRIAMVPMIGLMLLSGCGGGAGGSTTPTTRTVSAVTTLSSTAQYEFVPPDPSGGLSYEATTPLPIQDAVVEAYTTNGLLYVLPNGSALRTRTSSTGTFTLTVPQNATVRVVVKAAISDGDDAHPAVKVVDNAAGGALHGTYLDVAVAASPVSAPGILASSGWTGSSTAGSYTGARAAAPFAVLDAIHSARHLVRLAQPAIVFPTLIVNWSEANYASSFEDPASGAIVTSHFSPGNGQLYILGDADNDTDEFDNHVIAHEWFHWYQSSFSRDDSLGGSHGGGDLLDETVAFSEGSANAFSGMAFDDPIYADEIGPRQGITGVRLDLEADAVSDAATTSGRLRDGPWSEDSIQEVLWDLYDGPGLDTDDDGVALGFAPLHAIYTGALKTTPAFTGIVPFLHHLALAQGGGVDAVAAAENIGPHDEFDIAAEHRYVVVPQSGPTGVLATSATFGPIDSSDPGNKLFNRVFLKFTATTTQRYHFIVTPNSSPSTTRLFTVTDVGLYFYNPGPSGVAGGAYDLYLDLAAGQTGCFTVSSLDSAKSFTVQMTSTTPFGSG